MIYILIVGFVFLSVYELSGEGKLPKGLNAKDTWKNKYSSKVPFATTVLVWTTDLYHFSKMVWITSIQLVVSIYYFQGWNILFCVAGLKVFQGVIQEVLRWTIKKLND